MSRQITVAIAGTGSRGGGTYAQYQKKFPERMKIVALADPDTVRMICWPRNSTFPPNAALPQRKSCWPSPSWRM